MKKALIAWKPTGGESIASARLRAFLPCKKLSERGWNTEIFSPHNIDQYQIVIFQKSYSNEDIVLAETLSKKGITTVFDQCDNHYFNPLNDPVLAERAIRLKKMANVVQEIVVSTAEIGKLFPETTPTVIDDFIEPPVVKKPGFLDRLKLWRHPVTTDNRIHLVWYGSAGLKNPRFGMIDLTTILPELNRLNTTTPISLSVISNSSALYQEYVSSEAQFPTHYFEWKKETFDYIFKLHDICLIPISTNPFTVCKTNNRVVLSLLNDMPVIADRIPSYDELENFIAFGNWSEHIQQYVSSPDLIGKKVREGKQYIEAKYGEDKILLQWENLLNHLTLKYHHA